MFLQRYSYLPLAWTLAGLLSSAWAQDGIFDRKESLATGDLAYDLRLLDAEHSVSRERDSPPTKFRDTVRFNDCEDLTAQEGVPSEDQYPAPTRGCLTKIDLTGSDRIPAVIPLANSAVDAVEYTPLSSPKGLHLTFKGSSYPSSTSVLPSNEENVGITEDLEPTCDGKTMHSAGCGLFVNSPREEPEDKTPSGGTEDEPGDKTPSDGTEDEPGDKTPSDGTEDGKEETSHSVGSGIGTFFLLLLVAVIGYFALGAYYNYSTYGASGIDLIPHRDFWREVPYMLQDVVSHLCSAVRPRHRSNRGGYTAV